MNPNVQLETKAFFTCSNCENPEKNYLSHLPLGAQAGPWNCDQCGAEYWPTCNADGSGYTIRQELGTERGQDCLKRLKLLKLDVEPGEDVYLVVDGMGDSDDSYFYDEHTCPTNYLKRVRAIVSQRGLQTPDDDPHGVFKYVATAPDVDDDAQDFMGWVEFIKSKFGVDITAKEKP